MSSSSGQRDGQASAASQSPPSAHGGASVDFAARFTEAYPVLWVIAAGVSGQRGAAQDIVHDAAVQALNKLDQFEPGTDFRAWMSQIVRYVAMNHTRARRKQPGVSLDQLNAASEPASHADRTAQPDRPGAHHAAASLSRTGELPDDQPYFDDRMLFALESLDPTARACLLLRTLQGLSYADIAAILDIPKGTAMSHVHRSRRVLRQQLADRMPPENPSAISSPNQEPSP